MDSNWFFEDLMFPCVTVPIDLTGKIDDTSDRVKISRIILDSNDTPSQQIWQNNLSSSDYDYATLKSLLAYNGISYYEDEQIVELPLVSNTMRGTFQVVDDPQIIDGNTWYTLDTLTYSTINSDGVDQGYNNILSVDDLLSYSNSLYKVVGVDQNSNMIRVQIMSGSAFAGMYSIFTYYQDPFRTKEINVHFGAHEYDIVYVKGVNEDYNLLADEWSDPIKFSTDELVLSSDENMDFTNFYMQNVVDWGAKWIAEAKERNIAAFHGHTPNPPTLNANDLRVV